VDELEIQGKKYISSKRAAELTGYAKDYVGQLARAGKVPGTRVGRAWYVEETAFLSHFSPEREKPALEVIEERVPLLSPLQPMAIISPATLKAIGYGARSLPETWSPAAYFVENYDLIPRIQKYEANKPQNDILSGTAIRIKILDRQELKLPPARAPLIISEKAKKIRRKREIGSTALSLGAVAAALGVFLFFSSGFLLSFHTRINESGLYTANLEVGFEYTRDTLMRFPPFAAGVDSLQSFFSIIAQSFSVRG
jgi:hypothetical protein